MKFLGVEIRAKNSTLSLFDEPEVIPENAIMLDDDIHYAIKRKIIRTRGNERCADV